MCMGRRLHDRPVTPRTPRLVTGGFIDLVKHKPTQQLSGRNKMETKSLEMRVLGSSKPTNIVSSSLLIRCEWQPCPVWCHRVLCSFIHILLYDKSGTMPWHADSYLPPWPFWDVLLEDVLEYGRSESRRPTCLSSSNWMLCSPISACHAEKCIPIGKWSWTYAVLPWPPTNTRITRKTSHLTSLLNRLTAATGWDPVGSMRVSDKTGGYLRTSL